MLPKRGECFHRGNPRRSSRSVLQGDGKGALGVRQAEHGDRAVCMKMNIYTTDQLL